MGPARIARWVMEGKTPVSNLTVTAAIAASPVAGYLESWHIAATGAVVLMTIGTFTLTDFILAALLAVRRAIKGKDAEWRAPAR